MSSPPSLRPPCCRRLTPASKPPPAQLLTPDARPASVGPLGPARPRLLAAAARIPPAKSGAVSSSRLPAGSCFPLASWEPFLPVPGMKADGRGGMTSLPGVQKSSTGSTNEDREERDTRMASEQDWEQRPGLPRDASGVAWACAGGAGAWCAGV